MNEVEKLEEQILALEGKLARARQRRLELQALDPNRRLAVFLHDKFCRYNHTDGCGWDYEGADDDVDCWTGPAHTRWLAEAKDLMAALED